MDVRLPDPVTKKLRITFVTISKIPLYIEIYLKDQLGARECQCKVTLTGFSVRCFLSAGTCKCLTPRGCIMGGHK